MKIFNKIFIIFTILYMIAIGILYGFSINNISINGVMFGLIWTLIGLLLQVYDNYILAIISAIVKKRKTRIKLDIASIIVTIVLSYVSYLYYKFFLGDNKIDNYWYISIIMFYSYNVLMLIKLIVDLKMKKD